MKAGAVDYKIGEPCPFCGEAVAHLAPVVDLASHALVLYALHPCGHTIDGFWLAKVSTS